MCVLSSGEANRDAAQRAEVRVQHVPPLRGRGTCERTAEDEVSCTELLVIAGDLVCEPGDARGGMVQHTGGEAGFLDDRVLVQHRTHPAQVETIGAHLSAARHDPGIGGKIRYGIEYLAWRSGVTIELLDARVDDL